MAQDQSIDFSNPAEVRATFQLAALLRCGDIVMADMFDIGMAGRKALDFLSVDVESQGATSGLGVEKNEE